MKDSTKFISHRQKVFMAHCDICGKIGQFGRNVSHSNRHTNTRWLPNVHRTRLHQNGSTKKVFACTRCIRSQYKTV